MKAYAALFALITLFPAGCKKAEDKPSGEQKPAESGGTPSTDTSGTPASSGPVEISISCGSVGKDLETCKAGVAEWEKKTGNKVNVVVGTQSSTDNLAKVQQLLAAGSTDIDVFNVDVVWPGILGSFFIDLKEYTNGSEKDHFEAIIANNTVDGKLVAMPWFTDAGILYYRKDLLEKHGEKVPTTWEELTTTAKKIMEAEKKAGTKGLWGLVFQGKAYEGLTCDALEWVHSHGGGTIVDADGKVTIDNPEAAAALDLAASWIGTISPQDVLGYEEEQARTLFQGGKSVFMRNWPYAYALSQSEDSPVKGKVGIAVLPKGSGPNGRSAAAMGGWNLSVSKFSKHPKEAAALALYLTGPEEQKRRAIDGGFHPTIKSLYEDKEILEKNPSFAELAETFKNSVPRPTTVTKGQYNQVSNEFWNAVHAVLDKEKKSQQALADLKAKLEQISRGGRW